MCSCVCIVGLQLRDMQYDVCVCVDDTAEVDHGVVGRFEICIQIYDHRPRDRSLSSSRAGTQHERSVHDDGQESKPIFFPATRVYAAN